MNSAAKAILHFALVGLITAGAVVAVFEVAPPFPKEGTVVVRFVHAAPQVLYQDDQSSTQGPPASQGPPDRPSIVRLDVTIDSVQVHSGISEETGWEEIPSATITLDLMSPSGESVSLVPANISEQDITMVRMRVVSAMATLEGASTTEVRIPSGVLKVPVSAQIRGQLTTTITITPESVHIVTQTDPIIVTPVLHVQVDGPR